MTSTTHPSDLPAKYGVIRIVRLNYYRISIEALCNDGTYLYKEGGLDNLPTTDFTSFVKNADFARGFQSAVNIPANGYADREVSHGLSGTPVSAIATLKVNTTSSSNMANVQIQVNEITSSIIKVRIHNNTSNEATVNFYWAAFL